MVRLKRRIATQTARFPDADTGHCGLPLRLVGRKTANINQPTVDGKAADRPRRRWRVKCDTESNGCIPMKVLGIETSCDETGVAIYDTDTGLRAHCLHSQIDLHAATTAGGA